MAKSTGSKVWKVLVGILVALLILAIVAELGLRWFVGQQLRSSFDQQAQEQGITVEEDPEISFGASPLLFGLLGGTISQVDVSTPSTLEINYPDGANSVPEIEGTPAATVDVDDLDIADPNNPIARTMSTTTQLPEDMVLAMIQRETAGSMGDSQDTGFGAAILQELVRVTDVTAVPETNSLDVEFTGGAAVLSLEPVLADGGVNFQVSGAEVFGMDLPEQVSEAITGALERGVQDAAGDMEVTEFTVVEGGIQVSIRGQNVPLGEAASQAEI